MLEVCTSTVAWISVVVIQALMHYLVFGARRERIHKETEAVLLEESLSFSTSECSSESDLDIINPSSTPTGDISFSSISCLSSDEHHGNLTSTFETIPSISAQLKVSINSSEIYIARKAPFYLMQTGTEMLKV